MSDERLRIVRSCASPLEAELVRGVLRSAGIHSVISRDDSNGLGPDSWLVEGVAVLIHAKDAVVAMEVLRAMEETP